MSLGALQKPAPEQRQEQWQEELPLRGRNLDVVLVTSSGKNVDYEMDNPVNSGEGESSGQGQGQGF